jgi:ribosome biogenesis GTPase
MREFGLWEPGEALDETFTDIATLAERCHFRDCRHDGEPGCAVAAAREQGTLPEDRLASYEKLRREEAFLERQRDPRTQDRNKRRWKAIHKGLRARKKVDPKLRDD